MLYWHNVEMTDNWAHDGILSACGKKVKLVQQGL